MAYQLRHDTCSWHLYLLEMNHYSLGDISHDKCKCAYVIGREKATNKTTKNMYVTRLFDELRP